MIKPSPTLSINALNWLQLFFRERIASEINLTRDEDGYAELHVSGHPARLRFTAEIPEFLSSQGIQGYTYWDCAANGWLAPLGLPLPAPIPKNDFQAIATSQSDNLITINYDFPGLVFWALTRIEEERREQLDNHGRCTSKSSHAHRHGYLERPFIDEWIIVMRQMAHRLWPQLKLTDIQFSIEPSHDVDFPSRYAHCKPIQFARTIAKDILQDRSPSKAINGFWIRAYSGSKHLLVSDPYNSFDWIMHQSELRNLKSTFYFMVGGHSKFDPGYDITSPSMRALLTKISDRNHRIGLHPSYDCIKNPDLLHTQYDLLASALDHIGIPQKSIGARMHYYRASYPYLWQLFDKIGISHDATMGYADHVGFRAGTSLAFQAFDFQNDKMLKVRVKPLIIMEGTLFSPDYMALDGKREILCKIEEIKLKVRKTHGIFSILWHNSELYNNELKETYQHSLN